MSKPKIENKFKKMGCFGCGWGRVLTEHLHFPSPNSHFHAYEGFAPKTVEMFYFW